MIETALDWYGKTAASDKGAVGIMIVCLIVSQVALMGFIPTIIGNFSLGVLAGTGIAKVVFNNDSNDNSIDKYNQPVSKEVETKKEIVPYNQWPDECYVCNDNIPENMSIRGQYVVHKGESNTQMKAIPLCESCTWTHATLLDNHDRMTKIFDERENETEL